MDKLDLSSFKKRIFTSFLDFLILANISKKEPLSGYDILMLVHNTYEMKLSPSIVYYTLKKMENKGLITSLAYPRKKTYLLTDKGIKTMHHIPNWIDDIQEFIKSLVKEIV
ncbi:MAG: PadR family transcriptional regulator [Candidatus Bathyarchaeum tardum]|nr:MAG: PadR family transcriptional regulator [Candidatus Bathyarchaeum tardum]